MSRVAELAGVGFGHRSEWVVRGVDLSIEAGDLMVLIGADGAGKSTLLRLMVGLLRPSEGTITHAVPRARLGYSGAGFDLYPDLTVEENLRFFSTVRGMATEEREAAIDRLLRSTGLGGVRPRLGAQLSGGMKKKLSLAAALVHMPEVIFLDEPTVGVDPASRRELWDIVAQANSSGTTVVYSSPYLDEAERAQRVVLLVGGRAVELTVADLLGRAAGWQAWVVPVAGERRDLRRRLAAADVGPRAYLRDEGLTALGRDRDEALALLRMVLGPVPGAGPGPNGGPERRALSLEDAFVLASLTEGDS